MAEAKPLLPDHRRFKCQEKGGRSKWCWWVLLYCLWCRTSFSKEGLLRRSLIDVCGPRDSWERKIQSEERDSIQALAKGFGAYVH